MSRRNERELRRQSPAIRSDPANRSSTGFTKSLFPRLGARAEACVAALVLAVSIGAVYWGALDAPLIFDDQSTLITNHSITSLWPLVGTGEHRGPLNPAPQLPTAGRPLVNLSFATNYHFGRLDPVGFRAVNVAIHCLSGILLWAIVRRTLQLPLFGGRFARSANWLALAAAVLWALHPLQTEAVIYITQRTELMYAFFYLATLYCSLRYWAAMRADAAGRGGSRRRVVWLVLAVLACLAGMASKEMMVTAPVVVLLFERTFVAGSFGQALRRSWPLYVGLAATWGLLLALNVSGPRSASAGFNLGVGGYAWWLTQAKVLLMYLKLVVWPWPLLIHYQFEYVRSLADAWMYLIPALLLVIGSAILVWRNRPIGFAGAWVFAILSPTLVVPIVTEVAAERRMYLPLAAIIVLAVIGVCWVTEAIRGRRADDSDWSLAANLRPAAGLLPLLVLAVVYGLLSANRVQAYHSERTLWEEVLRFYPRNPMAQYNRGVWLAERGELPEAVEAFKTTLEHAPDDVDAINNLAVVLMRLGRYEEGIEYARQAVRLQPEAADAHHNLGLLLTRSGRLPEAIDAFRSALALKPESIDALDGLAVSLMLSGHNREAVGLLERAVRLRPDNAELRSHLGSALVRTERRLEALDQYRSAVELDGDHAEARFNLGLLLAEAGEAKEALRHLERAVALLPISADVHYNLGELLGKNGQAARAVDHFRIAVRLQPNFVEAYVGLVSVLAQEGRCEQAIAAAEKGLEVARVAQRQDASEQLERLLRQCRSELSRRRGEAAPDAAVHDRK
jgi:tetratricopeptide (TPR) repeat protein